MQDSDDLDRLVRTVDALTWARERLPRLVEAGSARGVLDAVLTEAIEETGAPVAWAALWTGDPLRGAASFRSLVSRPVGAPVPTPTGLSATIAGSALRDGRPVWSDDAREDARFVGSGSVRALQLRSVGCVPIGRRGVLYLLDADQPGRFGAVARARLVALCALAAPFVDRPAVAPPAREEPRIAGLVGSAPPMRELFSAIRAFAPMPWPALILGETGTGKEAVARALHDLSPRADQPFVAVNCAAIPDDLAESTLFGHERGAFTGADRRREGLVERVRGGTLFLDEVGELSARAQPKLLRLLQEGRFERVGGDGELAFGGRVIAATHRPLVGATGVLREDLYHRLSACVLEVAPLRDRRSDVPALAAHLLEQALSSLRGAPRATLAPEAVAWLTVRPWDGNVRELGNAVRGALARALARGSAVVELEDLQPARTRPAEPVHADDGATLAERVDRFQRAQVEAALAACEGNKTAAAERLGVSRQWLHRLIERWEA